MKQAKLQTQENKWGQRLLTYIYLRQCVCLCARAHRYFCVCARACVYAYRRMCARVYASKPD